jgi:SPP1 family predicted phage head-tail adaptor
MRIGELKTKVVFQSKVKTKDEFGTTIESWTNKFTMKCKVIETSGRKEIDNNEVFTSNSVLIECYIRDIKSDMKVLLNGNEYAIENINPFPYKNYMQIQLSKINK